MLFGVPAIVSTIFFIINITLTFTIIFLERKNPQSTYAWLLFLWIIPVLGFLFYLFFSQNLTKQKIYRYNTPEMIRYHEVLKKQRRSILKMPIIDPDSPVERYRETIQFHLNVSEALYTKNNSVDIFIDGHEKFDALFHA
ncbi:MAG: cardiolipin synthase, partial [Eubacteriaceae bacterium]|nr:cardiolipin synthase [Eubacteriaceae bacterium]